MSKELKALKEKNWSLNLEMKNVWIPEIENGGDIKMDMKPMECAGMGNKMGTGNQDKVRWRIKCCQSKIKHS